MLEENFKLFIYFLAVVFVILLFAQFFTATQYQQEKIHKLRDLRIVLAYVSSLDSLSIDTSELPDCTIKIYDKNLNLIDQYSKGTTVGISERIPKVISGSIYYFEVTV